MSTFYNVIDSPIGKLTTFVNENGSVVQVHFGEADPRGAQRSAEKTRVVDEQLRQYFNGERKDFDVELAPNGTGFQHQVWKLLKEIPFGETRSYGQLANQLGNQGASRAVGRANATNPIAIIVPCHRVIGTNGTLTGYAGGLSMKEKLLAFEQGRTGSLFD
jgi:methylated-DNA-[protein]-cysteine S-methyltransferase